MTSPNPRFTGLFIPVEILEIDGITHTDCMLLAWIDALYSKEHGGCYASNEYFSKKLKLKENTVKVLISKLESHGLIERVSFNGRVRIIRACKEKWFREKPESTAEVDLNQPQTLNKINGRGSLESTPLIYRDNSIDKRKDNNVGTEVPVSADADDLCNFFIQKLKERKPDFKKFDQKKWAIDFDRMIRIDNRNPKAIKAMIEWIHKHHFWSTVVLSPGKLREQYDQIDLQALSKYDQKIIKENKAYALKLLKKYPETFKGLILNENYVINTRSGKELSLKLPEENFKKSFVSMFGGEYNERD